jgi:hypothetical protein
MSIDLRDQPPQRIPRARGRRTIPLASRRRFEDALKQTYRVVGPATWSNGPPSREALAKVLQASIRVHGGLTRKEMTQFRGLTDSIRFQLCLAAWR